MPHDKRGAAAADAAEKISKKTKKARVHETAAAAADSNSENSCASDFELAGEEGNPIHIDSVDDTRARAIMDKYHSNGPKSS